MRATAAQPLSPVYSVEARAKQPQRCEERRAAEPQANYAKRLECDQLAGAFDRCRTSDSGSKLLLLIRISGTAEAPWARSANPAWGGLFLVPGPQIVSQTPLGVACESSPLLCHRERVNRPPLTGFENIIGCCGYYKQATPNGVLRRYARESKNACKVQRKFHALS